MIERVWDVCITMYHVYTSNTGLECTPLVHWVITCIDQLSCWARHRPASIIKHATCISHVFGMPVFLLRNHLASTK